MCYACTVQLANTRSTLQYVCIVNKTKLKKKTIVRMLKRFPLNDQTLWIEPQTSKVKIPLLHDLRFDTRRRGLNKTKTTPLLSLKWTYEGFYHFWLKNKFESKLLVHAVHMTSPANIYFFILSLFRSTSVMIILSFRNKESLLKRHSKSWDQEPR